jgi:hypothetical protein
MRIAYKAPHFLYAKRYTLLPPDYTQSRQKQKYFVILASHCHEGGNKFLQRN